VAGGRIEHGHREAVGGELIGQQETGALIDHRCVGLVRQTQPADAAGLGRDMGAHELREPGQLGPVHRVGRDGQPGVGAHPRSRAGRIAASIEVGVTVLVTTTTWYAVPGLSACPTLDRLEHVARPAGEHVCACQPPEILARG